MSAACATRSASLRFTRDFRTGSFQERRFSIPGSAMPCLFPGSWKWWRSETYQIYFTPENLEQGAFAAGLALKFYREGYRVCFPSEWLFVYSGHMACPTNERLIRLTLQRSDSSLTEPPAQNLFRLGEREILVSRDTP